ncbi:MAG: hypothetical protein WD470_10300 [Rhodospirillaceae bacterium]
MFDGEYEYDGRDYPGVPGSAVGIADPLAFLAQLERRVERNDRDIRSKLQTLQGRLDVLSHKVDGLREKDEDRMRKMELNVVALAERLDRVERARAEA